MWRWSESNISHLFPQKTKTSRESTITVTRGNFQPQKLFSAGHHYTFFAIDEQDPACHVCKNGHTHTDNTAVKFLSSSLPVCLTATVSDLNLQQLSTEGQWKHFFEEKIQLFCI